MLIKTNQTIAMGPFFSMSGHCDTIFTCKCDCEIGWTIQVPRQGNLIYKWFFILSPFSLFKKIDNLKKYIKVFNNFKFPINSWQTSTGYYFLKFIFIK